MFALFLIGLREGLEATLVVSILVAFLVKGGRRRYLPYVWGGVGAAIVVTAIAWAIQEYGTRELTFEAREIFEAVVSFVAVAFVTWMIFWMRGAARRLSGDLREKLAEAVQTGPLAVASMAFLAVIREGLETAILFSAAADAAGSGNGPVFAFAGGLASAIAIGVGIYFGTIALNLSRFFTWTGAFLVFVAAGLLKYGVYDLQEAGVLPGLSDHAFDMSDWYVPDAWYAQLAGGMFNVTAAPTVLETIAWGAYLIPVLFLFLRPRRADRTSDDSPAATTSPAESA